MKPLLLILLGLLGVLLISFLCINVKRSVIEAELTANTRKALEASGMVWATPEARGQIVTLSGVAGSESVRQQAGEIAQDIYGLDHVINQLTVAVTETVAEPEARTREQEKNASGSEETAAAIKNCQTRFDDLLATEKIHFNMASTTLSSASNGLLDKLAAVARSCPQFKINIAGHTDSSGPDELNLLISEKRALSVYRALIKRGIEATSMSVSGYGETRPAANNQIPEGRTQNRRIEFKVEER